MKETRGRVVKFTRFQYRNASHSRLLRVSYHLYCTLCPPMTDFVSIRVNAGRLKDHVGQTVRLICKTIKVSTLAFSFTRVLLIMTGDKIDGDDATVEATDGGYVGIKLQQVCYS